MIMKHLLLSLLAATAISMQATAQNRVMNISTSSKTLNMEQIKNTDRAAQLNRFLFAGYNTLCLPMSLSADYLAQTAADLQVERLAAIQQEGSTLYLYFLDCTDEGIEAGVPYLVFSPKHQNLHVKNTEAMNINSNLSTVRMSDANGNQVAFSGTWEALQQNGRYGIPAQQDAYPLQSVLVQTQADKTFLPTRCGFVWEQKASTATDLQIKHVTSLSEVTGINNLVVKGARVDVYDMKGNVVRRQADAQNALQGLPRGMYVVGGEKVSVK